MTRRGRIKQTHLPAPVEEDITRGTEKKSGSASKHAARNIKKHEIEKNAKNVPR